MEQRHCKKKKTTEENQQLFYSPSMLTVIRKPCKNTSSYISQRQENEMEKQILETLRLQEKEQTASFLKMKLPRFTTKFCEKMRRRCVSWLMDIAEQEKLSLLTLHFATSYIDRISSFVILPEPSLFCLTCLFIAGKRF